MAASELEMGHKGEGGWWGWSDAKRAVECLFWTGELTTATRRGTFERVYGLPEKVLPRAILEAPDADPRGRPARAASASPSAPWASRRRRTCATISACRWRAPRPAWPSWSRTGSLVPVTVKGWREPAYLDPAARWPRRVDAAALLSPFDNLIWFRERTERMFGVRYRIEIYTPAEKRTHGYYVLPFLEGDALTARVDLKADRKAGDPDRPGQPRRALGQRRRRRCAWPHELKLMAGWLGLERVRVERKGDLAAALARGDAARTRRLVASL